MKIQFNPFIEKLSGKLKDIVFVLKNKKMLNNNQNLSPDVYIRSLPKKSIVKSIKQNNLNKAFKLIAQKYKDLKLDASAFKTWQTQAKEQEKLLSRTVTAYLLFQSFYMTMYTHTLSINVEPTNLYIKTPLTWNNKNQASWTSITNGYGTGSYGTNTFST